ncbi:MAG: PPC domain-containing DNA-binding protein [bacterium]
MKSATFEPKKTHVLRLEKDRDLLGQLTDYCNEKEIDAAQISALGAVTEAAIAFYDQDEEFYGETTIDREMEMIQATGNVSYLEGERFVHMHATFVDEDDNTHAGHLVEGNNVFAGEATIQELEGPQLIRKDDPETGLTLWDL